MGASQSVKPKKNIVDKKNKREDNQFLVMKIQDKKLVYLDLKHKRIIPHLKPLQQNVLYSKRKL